MKFVSISLLLSLLFVSCAPKTLPQQKIETAMPVISTEAVIARTQKAERERVYREEKRLALSKQRKEKIAAGLAVLSAAIGYHLLKGNQSACGSCNADGFVDKGDRGATLFMKKAHRCGKCQGRGFH